jgi:hypothetical protein
MSNLQKSLAIFVKNRVPNNLDVIRGLAQNRLSFIEGFTQQLVSAPEVLSDAEFVVQPNKQPFALHDVHK